MRPTDGRRCGGWCLAIVFPLSLSCVTAAIAQRPSAPAAPPASSASSASSSIPGYHTERRVLSSRALGEERRYFVGVPESYSQSSDRRYPVIYVLDGLSQGVPIAKAAAQMSRDKLMPEIIFVAIPNMPPPGRDRDYAAQHASES